MAWYTIPKSTNQSFLYLEIRQVRDRINNSQR